MGILYLVATPIGNLEDMSPRAVRILRESVLVAAEDTRHSGMLLKHFEINSPLTSYFVMFKITGERGVYFKVFQQHAAVTGIFGGDEN